MAALNSNQQHEVVTLYESGLSMQQVANHFSVTIGAVLYTLRHNHIPRRPIALSNQIRYENQELSYEVKKKLSREEEDLKLSAIMLYWAEGYKVGKNTIDFANSDPEMAYIFKSFLLDICNVDRNRIRCSLYCYGGQDIDAITEFWSVYLDISKTQFTKPYVKQATSQGVRGPRMTYGLVHIKYCDKKLLQQILRWIEEYKKKCVGGGVVNRRGL